TVAQCEQPAPSRRDVLNWPPDLGDEELGACLERRLLKPELASEQPEQAALADLQILRESADREPVEPLYRGRAHRRRDGGFARAGDVCPGAARHTSMVAFSDRTIVR